jgi:hypothetical protein
VGKTVGGRYGDWSLAIYEQMTFDAIAAATAAPRPDPSALVRGRPSYRLSRFFPVSPVTPALVPIFWDYHPGAEARRRRLCLVGSLGICLPCQVMPADLRMAYTSTARS